MSKNILITGASSDIGIEVINKFLENNFKITAHINRNKNIKKKFKNNDNIQFITYDFSKINKTENFINKNKKLLKKIAIDPWLLTLGEYEFLRNVMKKTKTSFEFISKNLIDEIWVNRPLETINKTFKLPMLIQNVFFHLSRNTMQLVEILFSLNMLKWLVHTYAIYERCA